MTRRPTGEEGLARHVPVELRDEVLQRIEECAWGFATDPEIDIIDLEKRNVLNIEYVGAIRIDGVEHRFHVRSGDMAGTEILSWNGETEMSRTAPSKTTLVPSRGRVEAAVREGRAAELLQDWAEALDPNTERGRRLAGLPAAAAYDAFFAPGTGASRRHHEWAREAGWEIEETEVARRVRCELLDAAHPIVPIGEGKADPLDVLHAWDVLRDAGSEAGRRIRDLRARIISEIAAEDGSAPSEDHGRRMAEVGFAFRSPAAALRERIRLTRSLLSLHPIDGFDPAALPENPIAVLLKRLDPSLAPDVRVDPESEGRRLLDAVAARMGRDRSLASPDWAGPQAARLGFELRNRARPTPDRNASPSP